MMSSRLILVDLPEDGRRVTDCIRFQAKQPARPTPYLLGKGELRSRKNTNRCAGIFRRSEPARAGIEVVGGQLAVVPLGGTKTEAPAWQDRLSFFRSELLDFGDRPSV